MSAETERDALSARIAAAIRDRVAPAERDALLSEVAAWQARTNGVFARLCRARGVELVGARGRMPPDAWPAVPTDVFRFARVSTYDDPSLDVRVFLTSGTTSGARGAHAFRDLALYDLAAEHAARELLFGARPRMRLAMLAPHPDDAPDSSLSYMLGRFESWFGAETAWCWRASSGREGALDVGALRGALDASEASGAPIAILGTSFALVHADDLLPAGARWALPAGSLAMPTGGFKGRAREIDPAAMRALIARRFGIHESGVIGEYGMTELSSQMYEIDGALEVPPWVRATPVDPDTLRPVAAGEVGILRIDDLANLDSAVSIQTSDLARRRHDDRLELIGRAPGATPRGCSLAIEEALDARGAGASHDAGAEGARGERAR